MDKAASPYVAKAFTCLCALR